MTLEQCYRQLHGDYADVRRRLMTDRLVDKFVRKFTADPTMQQLRKAINLADHEGAFVAAHTLKGVAGNLSFTELQQAASCLTEQLRDGQQAPDPELVSRVYNAYDRVVDALVQYASNCSAGNGFEK